MKKTILPLLLSLLFVATAAANSSVPTSCASASAPQGLIGKAARAAGAAARIKNAVDHARSGLPAIPAKSSSSDVGTVIGGGIVVLLVLGWLANKVKRLVE